MPFHRLLIARALLFAAAAWCGPTALAQADKPGGMQSGVHTAPAAASDPPPAAASADAFDPKQLFANTCGWCHHKGGREAGKGPQLMGTTLTDGEIAYRIKNGKPGQMPAFKQALNDAQIEQVIAYIRNLKPEE